LKLEQSKRVQNFLWGVFFQDLSSNLPYNVCSLYGERFKLPYFTVFGNTDTESRKNGENEVTSVVHRTSYRHHTEDLKTDPERKLLKENFEPFCSPVAKKLVVKKWS